MSRATCAKMTMRPAQVRFKVETSTYLQKVLMCNMVQDVLQGKHPDDQIHDYPVQSWLVFSLGTFQVWNIVYQHVLD